MEVKLSRGEIKTIAMEVVKLLAEAGWSIEAANNNAATEAEGEAGELQPQGKAGKGKGNKGKGGKQKSTQKKARRDKVAQQVNDQPGDGEAEDETELNVSNEMLSISDAAKQIGKHPNTIRRAITHRQSLKASLVKGQYQIRQSDLDRWLRAEG